MGRNPRTTLKRVQSTGYTLYLYLPAEIVRKWDLKPGSYVKVEIHDDRLVIKPIKIEEVEIPT